VTVPGILLWGTLPYITLVLLVGGTVWRHRYDKFGWTTRSSQLYESRLLRIASPLFHFGIIGVFLGHVVGLLIPESWTGKIGVSEHTYHVLALGLGIPAGAATLVGIALLVWRRRTSGPVFRATTVNDKVMYVFLVVAIALGLTATLANAAGSGYDYRQSVSLWFRGIFALHPDVTAMQGAPLAFRVHAVAGMLLIAVFPFTRLVHAFSAPVQYVFRPYLVYRSRDPRRLAARPTRRGWEAPHV
jgi:nitrate reductase gamma subunit